jgi:streptogramin lyase
LPVRHDTGRCPDGNIWFVLANVDRIGELTPSGNYLEWEGLPPPPQGAIDRQPYALVAGPDGNLWYTENGSNRIGRMDFPPARIFANGFDEAGAAC